MPAINISSRISAKSIFQFTLALIPIVFSIYFIKHEGYELQQSFRLIRQARFLWVLAGLAVTIAYLLVHAGMYVASFASLGAKITFRSAMILSLKRSFISVFLPAGGISSLAFFTQPIEDQGISKTRTHLASSIYGISAFVSLAIIAVPALIILVSSHEMGAAIGSAFITLISLILILTFLLQSFVRAGWFFKLSARFFPGLISFYEELREQKYSLRGILMTLVYSTAIEICGIFHLYIAMRALGLDASLKVALLGYVVATLLLAVSPFMRGLGAVEFSLTYLLMQSGIPQIGAISVALLYRIFEFWIPLFTGAFSFFYRKDHLVMRVLPSFFTLILGMVNIVSVLTPAIGYRLLLLRDFIPEQAINFSNYAVFVSGIILIVLSAYMLRGLRNAWLATLLIATLSMIGHLTKAIDYEEALFSAAFIFLLIYTRKNYLLRIDKKLFRNASSYFAASLLFILIYGMAGFYLMDKKHFGIDFSFAQSFHYLVNSLILVNNDSLHPLTRFANSFLHSLNFLGLGFTGTLAYFAIRPARYSRRALQDDLQLANELLQKYGSSSLDYFKTYHDKNIYITRDRNAFVSFRCAGDYAVVLGRPVSETTEQLPAIINEFESYCADNGLKTLYYRVDESMLPLFRSIRKKALFIGQEGIVDAATFTLEGGDKKSTRNALNKLQIAGYTSKIAHPPIKEGLVQKLKAVSHEWLEDSDKKETAFSQGVWDPAEIKKQVVIYIEDSEEKVVAFANIIPDYAKDEGTYDLIRKTKDAPAKVLDALMVNMINYFREENIRYLNLGLAPFSGLEKGTTFSEKSIKFAYDNLKQLDHFKGLRFFKEKYAYHWHNKYLVYSNDLDLLQSPVIINQVGKYKPL